MRHLGIYNSEIVSTLNHKNTTMNTYSRWWCIWVPSITNKRTRQR